MRLPALVVGTVRHSRFRPLRHDFTHSHYQWLVDLAEPVALPGWLRRITDLRASDHLGGGATTLPQLRELALAELAAAGVAVPPRCRVVLLAHAHVLGHVFDPLSVFWCLDERDQTVAAILEVRNTYAGRHTYVLTPDPAGRAEVDKDFLVSPFNDTTGRYAVRLALTPDRVTAAIQLEHAGERLLTATVSGRPGPLTARSLATILLRHPLMPQRVSALIRVHGIYLWARRLPVLREKSTAARRSDPRLAPAGRHTVLTRGCIARGLVRLLVRPLAVRMRLPDGQVWGHQGPEPVPVLQVQDAESLFRRLETHPKIGLGESYMAGEWAAAEGTDLADLLTPFAARVERLLPRPVLALRGLVERAIPHHHRNTPEGSRANIAAHYDLSNDLFAAFLDETMTYSSALFDDASPWPAQSLASAQHRKIDAALDAAGVGPGTRLLEIGTGWGELATRAAARGADVTTITLSREQQALARERIAAAGLADRVDVRLCDYREVTGSYDAIVSIEMIEAVGEEFWPAYLQAIDRHLAPGGSALVQAILMDHQRLLATRESFGWIQKHIFPGGLIPSLTALSEVADRHTRLRITAVRPFGLHYAHTLRRWRRRFDAHWPQIEALGFDEVFRRQWEFYLAYCEAGFATGYLDVAQLRLAREGR